MTRLITTVLVAVAVSLATHAAAQDAANGGFQDIDIREVGKLSLNIKTGELERMEDGAKLTIISENEEDNMDVEAQTIDFEYVSGDQSPSKMILTGSVVISTAQMRIKAPKAIINTKTNKAEFIGTSEIYSEDRSPIRAENIQVDLDTGDIVMLKVKSIEEE